MFVCLFPAFKCRCRWFMCDENGTFYTLFFTFHDLCVCTATLLNRICQEPIAQHVTKIFLNLNFTFFLEKTWNYKGSLKWCRTQLACFTLEQMCKRISSSQWTRIIFSFSTFAACFKFPNLFFLFLLILKCLQKVFKTFLGFFTVWYEMFTTTLQQLRFQWAAQGMTFSISSVKSRWQVWSKCCHVPHSITPFLPGKWASGTYFLPHWPWMFPNLLI